jgi:hypothetical protein
MGVAAVVGASPTGTLPRDCALTYARKTPGLAMNIGHKIWMRFAAVSVALATAAALVQPSFAQNAAPPPRGQNACAERLQPGEGASPRLGGPADEHLSEKLERSEGVICPPAGVDPEIASPPPDGGKMPVIPPPGSPGGDQTLRPKTP